MGAALSSFRRRWWRRLFSCPPDLRVMMLGLDAAGKTTIWYRLKMDEAGTNSPTIGFGVETVQYKDFNFTVWDMGGRDKIRPLWRHYYQNTSALIWVVDSNDSDRLDGDIDQRGDSSRQELHRTLAEDELRGVPLLVFANKQDLPNARSTSEITQRLGLEKLRGREWLVQGCSADSGDGLLEGLEWLSQAVKRVGTVRHPSSVPAAAPGPTMDAIASHNPNLLAATALGSSAEPDASVHGASAVTPVPPSKPEPLAQESPSAAGETADTGTQSLSHAESVSSGAETFAASTQVDEFEPDFVLVERVQQT